MWSKEKKYLTLMFV